MLTRTSQSSCHLAQRPCMHTRRAGLVNSSCVIANPEHAYCCKSSDFAEKFTEQGLVNSFCVITNSEHAYCCKQSGHAEQSEGAPGASTKSSQFITYTVLLIRIFVTSHQLRERQEIRPNHHDAASRIQGTRAPLPRSAALFLGSSSRVGRWVVLTW